MSNDPKGASPGPIAAPTSGVTAPAPRPPSAQRPSKHDELRLLVNSRHPIITAETPEEERLEQLLLEVAAELAAPLYTWSVTTGLAKAHGAPIYNTDNPEQALANIALLQGDAIFLLKDFSRYCENDRVCRRLRELVEKFRSERRSIIITGAALQLPQTWQAIPSLFNWACPPPMNCSPA